MAMKKAYGYWELVLSCPYCDEFIEYFNGVETGQPYKGKEKCPACEKTFYVEID